MAILLLGTDGLISLELPNSVETIGSQAFYRCYGLKTLVLPGSLTNIYSEAFEYCSNLESITVLATTPPTLGSSVFYNVGNNIPVTVPCATIGSYITTNGWKSFTNYHTVGNCQNEITVTAYPMECGTVTGGGTKLEGATITIVATPNDGFGFGYWEKDGEVVSTNLEYTFVVIEDAEYKAIFMGDNHVIGESASTTYELPFYNGVYCNGCTYYSYTQQIYTAAELGNEGMIYGVAFNGYANSPHNITVYMKSINKSVFDDNNDWAPVMENDIVFNGLWSFEYYNQWNFIKFDKPFYYDGNSNVLIAVDDNTGAAYRNYYEFVVFSAVDNQSLSVYSDYTNYNPYNPSEYNGTLLSVKNQMVIYKGSQYFGIPFADDNVKALCVANWDTNGDGELSYVEAAAVTTIGDVFSGNTVITSFNEFKYFTAITAIEDGAFSGCAALTSIVIPEGVETIGDEAFLGCSNMAAMSVLPNDVPTLGSNVFVEVPKSIPVKVACGLRPIYRSVTGWNEFTNYIEDASCVYEITATANPIAGGTIIGGGQFGYGESCTVTAEAQGDYTFMNWMEDNEIVSTNTSYTFNVESNRNLVANFEEIEYHWTSVDDLPYNMTITGVVLVDGVEQYAPALELGAFCNDECRGTVLPIEYEGRWWYYMLILGDEEDVISFRLYDHVAGQEIDMECVNTVPFEIDGDIEPYEFLFATSIPVSVVINPAGAGTVDGAGNYPNGTSVTLTATANDGFVFNNWTVGDDVVSTETSYTFTINSEVVVNANFNYVQSNTLSAGWTWWSTYIEQAGINGLSILEDELGADGIQIKNQTRYVKRRDNGTWQGSLTSINNENGYRINVSAASTVTMSGASVSPADHPITIKPNWTWIGYPVASQQTVNTALADFEPEIGDIIKGMSGFAKYRSTGWQPSTFALVPGKSYMYYSTATANKTLVYAINRTDVLLDQDSDLAWNYDVHAYADNICVIAVVNIDGVEQRSTEIELGAFSNGEVRGSTKLIYDEETDRYLAMMTVSGEDGDIIDFGVIDDGVMEFSCDTQLSFHTDDIIGDFDAPLQLSFGGGNEMSANLYPNPVIRGNEISIMLSSNESVKEIIITNLLGEVVRRELTNATTIEGMPTMGVYMLQIICESGNVYKTKLIVK